MGEKESEIERIEVLGETCPVPLVEVRKAVRKSSDGDIIEFIGDHPASKKEIPMAVEEMGHKLLEIEEDNEKWRIKIQIKGVEG